jgi:hypothetical protein
MDEELLNLFLQATQGNKNVSSTLGNLDNPLLLFLAGQYDPMAGATPRGGELFSKYAGDPEYPAVNAIINLIEQDADKFQVKTAAAKMGVSMDTDIFDSATFESLADALYDEYTSGGGSGSGGRSGSGDFWGSLSRKGYRNPMDIYSSSDVPLPKVASQRLQPLVQRLEKAEEEYRRAKGQYGAAEYAQTQMGGVDSGKAISEAKSPAVKLREAKNPKVNIGQAKNPKVNIGQAKNPKVSLRDAKNPDVQLSESKTGSKSSGAASKALDQSAMLARQKQQDMLIAEMRLKGIQDEADSYGKGVLRYKAERGETPLGDQLGGIMRFIAQNR